MTPSTTMGSVARPIVLSISVDQASPSFPIFLSDTCVSGLKCCSLKSRPPTNQFAPVETSLITLDWLTSPAFGEVSALARTAMPDNKSNRFIAGTPHAPSAASFHTSDSGFHPPASYKGRDPTPQCPHLYPARSTQPCLPKTTAARPTPCTTATPYAHPRIPPSQTAAPHKRPSASSARSTPKSHSAPHTASPDNPIPRPTRFPSP